MLIQLLRFGPTWTRPHVRNMLIANSIIVSRGEKSHSHSHLLHPRIYMWAYSIHCSSILTLATVSPKRMLVKILNLVFRKPYFSRLLSRSWQSIHTTNPGNRHKTRVKYDNLHIFLLAIISPKILRVGLVLGVWFVVKYCAM